MAELIDKMQNIMCESCTSCEANWCDGEDKSECRWMQEIAEVGITTESEIRAMAISDFLKALEELTQKNWIDHLEYGITWADLEEVAEQLKEE